MSSDGGKTFDQVLSTADTDNYTICEVLRIPGQDNTPLASDSRYDFKVVALNIAGATVDPAILQDRLGSAGVLSARTALPSVPDAPPAPYMLTVTGGRIRLQLRSASNLKGAMLLAFQIVVNGTNHSVAMATRELAYDVGNLSASTTYAVQVALVTNMGTTDLSLPTIVTTTGPTGPSGPWQVAVSQLTASKAIVSWMPPIDTGGVKISGTILIDALSRCMILLLLSC
ncbi:hypothetical protein PINS_up000442 [Pythium insidiosum]|nr:hypothetical protein PINS_up000442 [Pythium insidiosum]